jgi:hypothetical protein
MTMGTIARKRTLADALRVVGRVVFGVIVLVTATAIGALFVAWPTPIESHTSIHMTVGATPAQDTNMVQYAVGAAP